MGEKNFSLSSELINLISSKSGKKIEFDDKREFVYQMFESLAKDYDLMNEIISFGRNLSIKKQVIRNVPFKPGAKILDLCTGTGDLAIFLAKYYNTSGHITAVDFSRNMLDLAVKKAKGLDNIEFIQGDALDLPFEDETFDACFVGYGLRNLVDVRKGILEMKRVVKKGGYVTSLDLGRAKGCINSIFRLYFFNIVPLFGKIFHGDFKPYRYLPESGDSFPSQEELVEIFKDLGFSEVKNYNYAFGTIAQQVARV